MQSDLIAGMIRTHADRAGVRVHAVIREVGASGGYWLACAADEIHANPMSIVGSIGVVGGGFGFPDLLGRLGIERRIYTAGTNKARLDPFSPEKPEDVAFAKDLMDKLHVRFKDWVRTRRGQRLKAPDEALFDGGYMLGEQALALGLIDGLRDGGGTGARTRRRSRARRAGSRRSGSRLCARAAAALDAWTRCWMRLEERALAASICDSSLGDNNREETIMRAAVFRKGSIVVDTLPDPVPVEGPGAGAHARLRHLRLRPACREAHAPVRQPGEARRQPLGDGCRPRRRLRPRVLLRGGGVRPGHAGAPGARHAGLLDADDPGGRDRAGHRLFQRHRRRLCPVHAAGRPDAAAGAERPAGVQRRA